MSEPRSYHGHPVIKRPVWTPEIPFYFYTGGLAGASAGLAYLAERRGADVLARRAWLNAGAGVLASPALLISDLGRPERFLNMLRLFKVTSPMSVGSWILSGAGAATGLAVADAVTGRVPAPLARAAKPAAALLGLPLSTYTAALVANTAVPAWHRGRTTLPFIFAGGAAASAGAAAMLTTPVRHAAPARRLTVVGSAMELLAVQAMEQQLGDPVRESYSRGAAGALSRAARGLTVAGALLAGTAARRSRAASIAAGALVTAGAVCERWAVYRAGFGSAQDPAQTIGPQRERIDSGQTRGAIRRAVAGAG